MVSTGRRVGPRPSPLLDASTATASPFPNWPVESERLLMRALSTPYGLLDPAGDTITHPHAFYNFNLMVMGFSAYMADNPDDPWFTQSFHRPLCDWLQGHILDWHSNLLQGIQVRKKLLVMSPRFSGKTWVCTKGGTAWLLLFAPNLSAMIGSETIDKAIEWMQPVAKILAGDSPYARWVWLYGNWYDKDRPWMKGKIVHAWRNNLATTEPSLGTWAVDTGITGLHPMVGWLDDPLSEAKMRITGNWLATVVREVGRLRPAFRPNSFFGVALTRKHAKDVPGKYLTDEGIKSWSGHPTDDRAFRELIAECAKGNRSAEWDVWFWQARDPITRQSTLPLQSTTELDNHEASNPRDFASEMQNSPASGDQMPLDETQIEECMIEKEHLPKGMSYSIHCDTAFLPSRQRGNVDPKDAGDESVIEVWGHDPRGNGLVYFIEGYGSKVWRADEFTNELIRIIQRYKADHKRILIMTDEQETGGKAGSWKLHLTNACHHVGLVMPKFEYIKRGARLNDKTLRITEAAAMWAEGRVRLVNTAPGLNRLTDQMLKIGFSANDDWADAAADVFNPLVYRPQLLRRAMADKDDAPIQPGDEILLGAKPRSDQALENAYDIHVRKMQRLFKGAVPGQDSDDWDFLK